MDSKPKALVFIVELWKKNNMSKYVMDNMRAKYAHKYLGCGKSTLWLYVKQGKINAYKLSDKVTIFKKEELDAFINASVEVVS